MNKRRNDYPREGSNGLVIGFVIFVVVLVITGIILLILYFTCTTPFDGSDKCICTNSEGKWDDDKSPKCTCPTKLDYIEGKCVDKCSPGEFRDKDNVCKQPILLFMKLANQAISGYNKENYQNTTPDACARLCLERDWCNSVDFNHTNNSCFLQDNPKTEPTYATPDWDNYVRN